mmetsp:Transcript_7581/g.17925  ORF Transcript_7581/g.17925 Transcript_7581/m.17925 type:complete len:260 (+) Transcript_7581:321-1100(+)
MLPLLMKPPQRILHRHLQHSIQIPVHHRKLGVLLEHRLELDHPRELPRSLVANPRHLLEVLPAFRRGRQGQAGDVHLHLAAALRGLHLLLPGAGNRTRDGARDPDLSLLRRAHPTRLALRGVRLRPAPPADHQPLEHERRQRAPLMHLLQGAGHVDDQLVVRHLLVQLGRNLLLVRLRGHLRLRLRAHGVVLRDLGQLLLELHLLALHLLPGGFQVLDEQHAPEVVLLPLVLVGQYLVGLADQVEFLGVPALVRVVLNG